MVGTSTGGAARREPLAHLAGLNKRCWHQHPVQQVEALPPAVQPCPTNSPRRCHYQRSGLGVPPVCGARGVSSARPGRRVGQSLKWSRPNAADRWCQYCGLTTHGNGLGQLVIDQAARPIRLNRCGGLQDQRPTGATKPAPSSRCFRGRYARRRRCCDRTQRHLQPTGSGPRCWRQAGTVSMCR